MDDEREKDFTAITIPEHDLIKTDNDKLLFQAGVAKGKVLGVKWQQEQSYSAGEVIELMQDYERDKFNSPVHITILNWFLKNKK